jgi:hypothetical protein
MPSVETEQWQPMSKAPKDGTRIIVVTRATEQGPPDVDVVRWVKPKSHGEFCWVSTDSDRESVLIYDEWEVANWMPLPSWSPPYKTAGLAARLPGPPEAEGSGI